MPDRYLLNCIWDLITLKIKQINKLANTLVYQQKCGEHEKVRRQKIPSNNNGKIEMDADIL